uniref:Innexin n=1 Tax=Plectus sambesii TaxID=2011161 RepID=A0A914WI68_9BILA
MDKLSGYLTSISKPRYEEDFVDRLNYRVTGYILLAAALTLSAKTYIMGDSVQCWVPAQFKDGWEEYVENYCLVENTYWVAMHDELPGDHSAREERQLSYYQWVPFVLALQALMFSIPHIIWRMLNWLSGIEVRAIITMASNPADNGLKADSLKKTTDMIARHLKAGLLLSETDSLSTSSNPFAWIARWTSGLVGAYITITYLIVKLLFIINCILQFVLLNAFLGTQYKYWGAEILSDLVAGRDWFNTGHFPRVTMCDFQVRQLGNLHRWSVQCVLVLNLFNEKVYLFLWWWFLVVTIVTILNFIYWLVSSSVGSLRKEFLLRMLNAHHIRIETTEDRAVFDRFADHLIRSDGVVVLRLLARNAGDIIGSTVVATLWEMSKEELKKQLSLAYHPNKVSPDEMDAKYN